MTVLSGVSFLLRLGVCLALLYFALTWWRVWSSPGTPTTSAKTKRASRPLKPRTPADCPDFVRSTSTPQVTPIPFVRPWTEVKSSRGRPKTVNTEGDTCNFEDCPYRRITDSRIHALVGYGHHGKDKSIQDLAGFTSSTN